jgi:hypothetical protein
VVAWSCLSIATPMPRHKIAVETMAYFRRMVSQGREDRGKLRTAPLSLERRKEIAQKAIAARWAKAKAPLSNGQ